MPRKPYLKVGQPVIANTFDHKEIIGKYHSRANSFGVYVMGKPRGTNEPDRLHKCMALTIRPYKISQVIPTVNKINRGEYVSAEATNGQTVTGFLVQTEGKQAWVKGWIDGVSHFEPQQTYKVKRDSLRIVRPA